MSEQAVEALIEQIIEKEGEFVDHPDDLGGATRWGITRAKARAWGYKGPMSHLPRVTAQDIYRQEFYIAPGYNLISPVSPKIAAEVMDTGVNMGVGVASRFLQRALTVLNRNGRDYPDIKVDGAVGPKTVEALKALLEFRNGTGEKTLLKALNCLQGARYIELAEHREKNESFVYGWLAQRIQL